MQYLQLGIPYAPKAQKLQLTCPGFPKSLSTELEKGTPSQHGLWFTTTTANHHGYFSVGALF